MDSIAGPYLMTSKQGLEDLRRARRLLAAPTRLLAPASQYLQLQKMGTRDREDSSGRLRPGCQQRKQGTRWGR